MFGSSGSILMILTANMSQFAKRRAELILLAIEDPRLNQELSIIKGTELLVQHRVVEAMDEYEQDDENQEIIAQMIEGAQRVLDDVS